MIGSVFFQTEKHNFYNKHNMEDGDLVDHDVTRIQLNVISLSSAHHTKQLYLGTMKREPEQYQKDSNR